MARKTKHVPSNGGYQWTCPFCGASRLNRSEQGEGPENAITALRSHILATNGIDHGPRNTIPDEDGAPTLDDHVVCVDDGNKRD